MRIIPSWDTQQRWAKTLEDLGWVCHPPGESCVDNPHAYPGQQDTSESASLYVLSRTGTKRRMVYDRLKVWGPATDVELQQGLGMVPNTERPRRRELVIGGFVQDSGARKKHHGEEHIVWEVARG